MNPHDDRPDANLIEPEHLFRAGDHRSEASDTSVLPALEPDADPDLTSSLPRITRLPEGIEVIEQSVGRAEGHWILQVRCQCGRRWFEQSRVEATHCPRCGMYVYIDVAPGSPPTA